MVEAEEIIRHTANGQCQPFVVRDVLGELYIVKGMATVGQGTMVHELICAEIGSRFGLPVAPYDVMYTSLELTRQSRLERVDGLSSGPSFASRLIPNASSLSYTQSLAVPEQIQRDILVFDLWIGNADRQLGPLFGNVNLLTSPEQQVVVIDHNLAFCEDNPKLWVDEHVFSDQIDSLNNYAVRDEYHDRFTQVLSQWPNIIASIPDEWIYWGDPNDGNTVNPDLNYRFDWLSRVLNDPDKFWSFR